MTRQYPPHLTNLSDPAARVDLDAPSDKTTPEWQRERAAIAVTVLLTRLGYGTPMMRGEYCGVELPDGSRCMYGRHHKIRKHRSDTGQLLAVAQGNEGT